MNRALRAARGQSNVVHAISILVGGHGLFIIATTLLDQILVHHNARFSEFFFDIPVLVGVSLLFLSSRLWRHKHTAFVITILVYMFYLGLSMPQLFVAAKNDDLEALRNLRAIAMPLIVLPLLYLTRDRFVVRSDVQTLKSAARISAVLVFVAILYGMSGFLLLDRHDFHQEIGPLTALHYTVDQFDLTTARPLQPHTHRAHLFLDSLSFISIAVAAYIFVSLFQPLKIRFTDQRRERQVMLELLAKNGVHSEDFFKVWPHDKQYFFNAKQTAGLAFHVSRGVALCLGDPVGDRKAYSGLLGSFDELCYRNDWLPAFIHVTDDQRKLYERTGYTLQAIGQEAVVDLEKFEADVANSKYFRQIRNRFSKQSYTAELLQPPHHPALLARLKEISDYWLSLDGRVERGFVMGFFTEEYMQLCPVLVARDAAGTIQAFINQVPADFDRQEATFDMLRHSAHSLGNVNDYLLMEFIKELKTAGYKRLNLGLCPLAGLSDADKQTSGLIDNVMRFAYVNGDRFYSFTGLYRFKAKYQPTWRDRYIAYQAGLRGFSRTTTALMLAMKVKR